MEAKVVLQPFLSEATKTVGNFRRVSRVLAAARKYAASVPRKALSEVADDLQVLMRLLNAVYRREYSAVSQKTILLLVATLVYFVTPVDAIPDALPIVGFIDDCAVLAWVCRSVRTDLDAFANWEQQQNNSVALGLASN